MEAPRLATPQLKSSMLLVSCLPAHPKAGASDRGVATTPIGRSVFRCAESAHRREQNNRYVFLSYCRSASEFVV